MDLKTYLGQPGKSATALAKLMGVSHTTVLRWADGTFRPGQQHLAALVAATDGQVTAAEASPEMARLFSSGDMTINRPLDAA